MNHSRIAQTVRIAVSLACAVASVALIALWVRSYWYFDGFEKLASGRVMHAWSVQGRLTLEERIPPTVNRNTPFRGRIFGELYWGGPYFSEPIDASGGWAHVSGDRAFGYFSNGTRMLAWAPHCAFVLLFSTLAAAPWFPWSRRFSLRTLLIVMTLLAIVLGLAVTNGT
jgi:hypothetical protein